MFKWAGIGSIPIKEFKKFLEECFHYDETSGKLYWAKHRPLSHFNSVPSSKTWHSRFSGKEAGHIKPGRYTEYRRVKLLGTNIECHTLIWILLHGEYPSDEIDHIDGNGLNNRPHNLRDHSNEKNRQTSTKNKTGRVGVYWNKQKLRWIVTGGRKQIGSYPTLLDACCKRKTWELENSYTPNHI